MEQFFWDKNVSGTKCVLDALFLGTVYFGTKLLVDEILKKQEIQWFFYSSTSHVVASHVVSEPDASSPSAFVVPGGHDLQTWEETYSFAEHLVTSHSVSSPDASSPSAFVVPGGQVVQTWETTCSFAEHKVG